MLEHVPKDLHSLSVNNVPKNRIIILIQQGAIILIIENEMNSAQFVYFQKSSDGF